MSPARRAWWQDKLLQLVVLLFGAGVAWGAMKLESRVTQERQAVDHAVIEDHESRIDELEQCMSSMAATQEGLLEQMTQMNSAVQSINEFLRQAAR